MKKSCKTQKDELHTDYKISDFPDGLVRGKYVKRMRDSSSIIVLKPEVANVFPNKEAVNKALLSLIELSSKTIRVTKRTSGRAKKLRSS